ncbi:MAG: phenylalanine--tRNA ligase subunit beta, partial [Candidatus Kapabacteria bacterium]|nr:phenylalanine--tRNA ligase subunit beta [Candidatus Kapabacteria bacterium]
GIRPRNAVVDVTNYVLMECGHPLHAFDADTISGGSIIVKPAKSGDKFTTLDGKERELTDSMLMICDEKKYLAVAGVMGGENSAITMNTTNVLIESAMFAPSSIRKTARTLGINSDASYRYERGADIDILEYAVNRAASLIQEICGGEILQGIAESYPVPAAVKHITLRFERARALLGYDISNERIRDMMRRLSFTILTTDEESCSLTIPHYRIDVHTETDVIEEIAINVHYDAIPVQTFSRVPFDRQPLPIQYAVQSQSMRLKSILRYAGFNEILTQNQIDPQRTLNDEMTVHIANPLGQELSAMRDSLTPSMLTTARYNFRNGASSLRLFEVGNTFRLYNAGGDTLLQSDAIHLQEMLCLCIAGEAQSKEWYSQPRQSDVYDMIGVIDHIMKSLGADYSLQAIPEEYRSANSRYYSAESLAICHRDTIVGTLFMLSSEASSSFDIEKPVVLAEISLDVFNTAVNQERKYIPVSKYPMVQRDISLIVDQSITTAALLKTIRQSDAPIRRGERVFDVYSGKPIEEGKKSVSIALFYQSNERTLTDTEVDESVRVILNSLTEQHHAYLRA